MTAILASEVDLSELADAWDPAVPVLLYAGVALSLYAQAFVRLRQRGRRDLASVDRALLFALGIAVAVLALDSPLGSVGESYLLSGHMLQHVLITDVAPALLLLGLRGPLLFFFLPPALLRPLARVRLLRAALAFLLRPSVSFGLWAALIALWHLPTLYQLTLRSQLAHDLMHAGFFLAGLLLWYQLLDPAHRRRLSRAGRLGFAVAVFAAGQVLSMVLIFSFEPLYSFYANADRLLGLSPLADQRLAGLVMMLEQMISLGAVAAYLLVTTLERPPTPPTPTSGSYVGRHSQSVASRPRGGTHART